MDRYQGTKRLGAKPMTRGEYNAYRGWTMPEGEDPADAGYLVEYEDGGKANDSRHAGYISWSPADVFERSYVRLPELRAGFAPHQQRVIAEKAELETKLDALNAFRSKTTFADLDPLEQSRLNWQATHMQHYLDVLGERIAAF